MSLVKKQYDNFVWEYKYRPSKVRDIILPTRYKKQFQKIIDTKQIPNMILCGPRGCGKTTSAFCIADEIGSDVLYINMSKDNSIDIVRSKITKFATNVSFEDGKKLVIGDECDRLSIQAFDALKADMDQFGKNCTFIFTSNHKHRIYDHPIMSRLQEIDFEYSKEETLELKKQFYNKVCKILKNENIKFEKKSIGYIVNALFPDMRKVLVELQKLSSQFDVLTVEHIKSVSSASDIEMLFSAISDRDFDFIREYVAQLSIDPNQLYSILFNNFQKYINSESIPTAIMIINENQYRAAFSVDKQIPITACCVELSTDCDWGER